jgi:hypothetical protein
MNEKEVLNGTGGKITRSIGYLLLLCYSLILLVAKSPVGIWLSSGLLSGVSSIIGFCLPYAAIALFAGLLLIIWSITRSLFLKIALSVFLLLSLALTYLGLDPVAAAIGHENPEWLTSEIVASATGWLADLGIWKDVIVGGISLVSFLLLALAWGLKKPRRIATTILTTLSILGTLIVAFGIVLKVYPDFDPTLAQDLGELSETFVGAFASLTPVFYLSASLFGICGLAKK